MTPIVPVGPRDAGTVVVNLQDALLLLIERQKISLSGIDEDLQARDIEKVSGTVSVTSEAFNCDGETCTSKNLLRQWGV